MRDTGREAGRANHWRRQAAVFCILSFDCEHSEVYLFKTPHHPDYRFDRFDPMIRAALATAAAPVYYRPLVEGGYTFVDGGIWANNPSMLAVNEALTAFDVERDQIDVLSLGCGNDPHRVNWWRRRFGGLFFWTTVIFVAMRLQSLAATNQAQLLLGPSHVLRIDAPTNEAKIAMGDCRRAVLELVPAAEVAATERGESRPHVFRRARGALRASANGRVRTAGVLRRGRPTRSFAY